jgi:hypothetical protein
VDNSPHLIGHAVYVKPPIPVLVVNVYSTQQESGFQHQKLLSISQSGNFGISQIIQQLFSSVDKQKNNPFIKYIK